MTRRELPNAAMQYPSQGKIEGGQIRKTMRFIYSTIMASNVLDTRLHVNKFTRLSSFSKDLSGMIRKNSQNSY